MKRYLNNLVKQFVSSQGIKNIDLNSEQFIQELNCWLEKNNEIGNIYLSYINDVTDGNICKNGTVEIGKSVYDTITLNSPISMITTNIDNLPRKKLLLQGNFCVNEGEPCILKCTKKGNNKISLAPFRINKFITQNPNSEKEIENWNQLNNYTVGIFGNIYDCDIDSKIKLLSDFKSKLLDGSYIESYDTLSDLYFYVLSSKEDDKKHIKVK